MIAITGHRGFIGSRLLDKLYDDSEQVCELPKSVTNGTEIYNSLNWYYPDVIYHLATRYIKDPLKEEIELMVEANYSLGIRLLDWSKLHGCKFIYTTSYFADDPKSLYALQKRHIEETAKLYHDLYGVKVAIVKVFNTWSLDDTRDLFLSRVVRGEVKESDLTEPDGIVKYSHVDEVVKCLADLADKDFDYIKIEVPHKEMTAKELLKVDWSKQ